MGLVNKVVFRPLVQGHKKVAARTRRLERAVSRKAMRTATAKGLTILKRRSQMLVPKRTGELRRSIKKSTKSRRRIIIGKVFTRSNRAHWVEFGTKPHWIRSPYGQVMTFKIRGKTITARAIHHPGAKPYPYMRPALALERRNVRKVFRKELIQAIARHTVRTRARR